MINLDKIQDVLSIDSGMIIWLSCIDSEKSIKHISTLWKAKYDVLYKGKIKEQLEDVGLITVRENKKGTIPEHLITSKTDWLAEHDFLKDSMGYLSMNPSIIPFLKSPKNNKLAVFNSDCFRKVVMNIERTKRHCLSIIDSLSIEPENTDSFRDVEVAKLG